MPRALISVWDKTGIVPFAQALVRLGWEIVSTGGTARTLKQAGVPVVSIETVTGFPEMLDGRVKTLHPAIHGGLLARRDLDAHMKALEQLRIAPIDLVAVNLYPFRETIAKPGVSRAEAIEQIDIGGPSMLRSAAKNHASVFVVVDPSDYERVLEALEGNRPAAALREELAAKVFHHTSAYDAAIATYLAGPVRDDRLPERMILHLARVQPLRYGENPEQRAAFYAVEGGGLVDLEQLQGKELSFNNLLDLDAALAALVPWAGADSRPACVIIKHNTPCGIALGRNPEDAYRRALATDPTSAFGSVIGFSGVVDEPTATAMSDLFVEAVLAPDFAAGALALFARKKNLRVVRLPSTTAAPAPGTGLDFKRVHGGFLAQDRFRFDSDESGWTVATTRRPTEVEWRDLRFAWAAVAAVKSNAILLARDEAAIGIGAGQMSRVDASFLAVHKARAAGHDPRGSALASDAFFPFPDGVEQAAAAGVATIIQPGGSVRDDEVARAADRAGMAMVLTGRRQFRH
ncbi:MAG TPA: bifunctional phosphoribosylaminoimidazolecarboxamide formyltransferase/IMP cyclohydrolase [Gemmatimonadales bacterium]|nr:bifunctional phosphoribosylaminoimidazolecarboxamide formyltransferase/IMP cyclohydrolase [Gemmatimonadales bacterium]